MEPSKFKESNKRLLKPQSMTEDECGPLDVFTDGQVCVSLWRPSFKEWLSFLFFKKIWVYIHSGETQPPIAILARQTVFENE